MMKNDTDRWAGPIMRFVLVVLLGLLIAGAASAAEPAGRVLTTKGVVTATDRDDFKRPLSRNDVVYPGETLRTGPDARLQVRFHDDALVDLKAGTEFEIERYRESTADEGGSAVMNLIRGAMRTITGAIGKGHDDEYAVDTPVATIGIRGTDYSLEFCDAACAGNGRAAGLYGRVDDGSVVTETGAGSAAFSTGDYFFVPQGGAPQRTIVPPDGILVDDEDEDGGAAADEEVEDTIIIEDDGQGSYDDPLAGGDHPSTVAAGPTYEAGEETTFPPNLDDAFVAGAFAGTDANGAIRHGAGLFDPSNGSVEAWVDADGNLIQVTDGSRGFASASAELADNGVFTAPSYAVTWGRWAGDFLIDDEHSVSGDMYFAYTKDWTPTSVIDDFASQEIALSYTFDSTQDWARTTNGNWSLSTFSLDANFATSSVALQSLVLDHQDDVHFIEFTNTQNDEFAIAGSSFSGNLNGTLQNNGDLREAVSGGLEGAFLGRNAEGALVAYSIEEMNDFDAIDGIAILSQP